MMKSFFWKNLTEFGSNYTFIYSYSIFIVLARSLYSCIEFIPGRVHCYIAIYLNQIF